MNLESLIDPRIKDIRFSKTIKISWSKYYGIHALVPVKDIIWYNNSRSLDAAGKCFMNCTNFNYTLYKKENNSPIMSIDFKRKRKQVQ